MDFARQVKDSVDILKVIGEFGVQLKKQGKRFVGLCPFHQEKSPSFSVDRSLQFYYCFGCQAGGDVFKFVMQTEGLSFVEALHTVAERNGIPIPKRTAAAEPEAKLRGGVLEMHEIAAQVFRQNLISPAGAEARAYLSRRGVTGDQAEEFGLGFALNAWDQLTRRFQESRVPEGLLAESGLVVKRESGSGYFDLFRNRLIFPIHNESGKVIAFGGRTLDPDGKPKYLNSPETPIYNKSSVLYNLNRAKAAIRKSERVVLVEGYMDVIGVYSSGVQGVVAPCGTALRPEQVRSLRKHTQSFVVNFDPDAAGANASEKSIQLLLEEGMHVRVLELDGGLDPDEYIREHGAEAYSERLDRAPGYFHWLADRARRKFDTTTGEGRIAGLKFLLPAIQLVSDKLERAAIADEVASYMGVERGMVLEHFKRIAADRSKAAPQAARNQLPHAEKLLLNALLSSAEAREQVLPELLSLEACGELVARPIFDAIQAACAEGHFDYARVEQRLDDRYRALLSNAVFADEGIEDEASEGSGLQLAMRFLGTMRAQNQERVRSGLRQRVKEAERTGNLPEAMRLIEELNRLSVKRN